jgi:hypothetical protein
MLTGSGWMAFERSTSCCVTCSACTAAFGTVYLSPDVFGIGVIEEQRCCMVTGKPARERQK